MIQKISFQNYQNICNALGDFGEARSQKYPDKDVILTVKKINGEETLQSTRLSKMKWHERLIRWFGFGGATPKAVAKFLEAHEPVLCRTFSDFKNREVLSLHLKSKDDQKDLVNDLVNIPEEKYDKLKKQKSRGCEIFKNCLSHHNRVHSNKVYILLQEDEKIKFWHLGKDPMGLFPPSENDERFIHEHYRAPIIDKNEFVYLDPQFRSGNDLDMLTPAILGFCYEYGLGTKKDLEKAYKYYSEAAEAGEYSACYNLARLLLKQEKKEEAADYLNKAYHIILQKIDDENNIIEAKRGYRPHEGATPEEVENFEKKREQYISEREQTIAPDLKKWYKAIDQIQFVNRSLWDKTLMDELDLDKYHEKLLEE